jgi:DNA invertase Pin-like site-specific DNA recombinase
MSTERRTAISYSRFSDPKQAEGDSEERQERMFRSFCQQHNLTPLRDVYADRGRSGYHGAHRKKGDLGKLIDAAKDGRFERGTVIVIEAWDRIGRLRPDEQTALVAEVLKTGVDIGVCRLNDVFTEADFGSHKWAIFSAFAMLAHQESKQKSDRIGSAWDHQRRLARAEGKPMRGRIPAWLQMVNGALVPCAEKVKAVQRVFQLSAAGYGQARIIRTLIAEKVPPLGKKSWSNAYIALLLNDRRVLGELQFKKGGKADGEKVLNYYPRIVSEAEFALARAGQEGRRGRHGNRDRKTVNTFQSLLTCALDGEGFFLHDKGERGLRLVNLAGRNGRAPMVTFPYDVFEEAILGQLREIKPESILPRKKEEVSVVDTLRAAVAKVRADIAGLQADLKEGYSKALASVLREREAEEEKIARELQDALAQAARPADKAWQELPGLVDLIRKHGDEARLKIRGVLRSILQDARVLLVRRQSRLLAACQLFFHGGAVRSYLIVYQVAARHKASSWSVRSLASIVAPGDLDLRRREDAAKAEAGLLKLDLEWLAAKMRDQA